MTAAQFHVGDVVVTLKHRFAGFRGSIISHDKYRRFFQLRLTHDDRGRQLAEPITHGLYSSRELEPYLIMTAKQAD